MHGLIHMQCEVNLTICFLGHVPTREGRTNGIHHAQTSFPQEDRRSNGVRQRHTLTQEVLTALDGHSGDGETVPRCLRCLVRCFGRCFTKKLAKKRKKKREWKNVTATGERGRKVYNNITFLLDV